jgi:hypothetical protein
MKSTIIPHWENAVLRIGFQFFNILNHPNFGLPFPDSSDPHLGVIGYMAQSSTTLLGNAQSSTSFVGTNQNAASRMIQLKAELVMAIGLKTKWMFGGTIHSCTR